MSTNRGTRHVEIARREICAAGGRYGPRVLRSERAISISDLPSDDGIDV